MKKYTYMDLFAGAGGMSLGFDNAGFKNLLAVEFNKDFAETYKKNFPRHNLIVDDIKNVTEQQIYDIIKNEKVDVIIGGPPCQGFSIAGNIGRNFIDDDRNRLFKEFVRFVKIIKPRVFVLENVAAMERHDKGKTIKEIVSSFKEIGYDIKYKVLNAVNFGVPQERRRIFIVGTLGENNFEYPQEINKIVTVKDAIDDLPKLENGETSEIPNHTAMKHSAQMLEKMSYVSDGGNRNDIPENLRPKSGDSRKYIRYDSKKPSFCVTGDMRKIFHYSQNRALTCRELARLQTFPDSFVFLGNTGKVQQQIGNAVPVLLASKIALQVKEVLDNE
ncbi:MAG: DNA (cytosine-5-)-methyltransferase [Firmicutes bacterium]|jgi:DNA (cytosine-5-)-methyltransferase|nr:DNA (cytosine-5-)-methyltransferase [Bacillota bacterium]